MLTEGHSFHAERAGSSQSRLGELSPTSDFKATLRLLQASIAHEVSSHVEYTSPVARREQGSWFGCFARVSANEIATYIARHPRSHSKDDLEVSTS